MRLKPFPSVRVLLFVLAVLPAPAFGQDSLQAVRELYASAAYEDVLSAVGKLDPASAIADEAEQYRVFCLVALGRMNEAGQAVEAVLMARPEYTPDPAEASPRIQTLFSEVRQRIAPGLVKKMYQKGRAAMERKDREEAIAGFEAMLRLADAPEIRDDAMVVELKELGSGFLELSRTIAAVKAPAVAEVTPHTAAPARTHVIVPPAIIQQRLPRWVPDMTNRTAGFQGAVRVQISAEGRVLAAEITKSIHPAYDQLLLRATKGWLYQPAQKDGVPIPIDKTVEITIAPSAGTSAAADKSQPF